MNASCARTAGDPDAYVSGLLSEQEQLRFEEHFFECEACLAAVQRLQALQQILADAPAETRIGATVVPFERSGPSRPSSRSAAWMLLVAASLVAMTGVGVWELRRNAARPEPATTDSRAGTPPADSPSAPVRQPGNAIGSIPGGDASSPPPPPPNPKPDSLALLAVVVPPAYHALTTREAQDEDARVFAAAMVDYGAKRYGLAASRLGGLAERSPGFAPAQFFLGISQLMTGAPARATLQRAIDLGVPPYSDEAWFYLAKAEIRQGHYAVAERALQEAIDRDAGPEGEAARLLRELQTLRRR